MTGAVLQLEDVARQKDIEEVADVVIVGSGAAGATAARVLTAAGVEVVLLEEGPSVPLSDLRSDLYSTFKNVWRDAGMQAARGRALTPILQGSCVGGTTTINAAIVHRLPEPIVRAWREEHGIGEAFGLERLESIYDTLDRELAVDVAPEDVLGDNSKLLRAGVEALGLRGNKIRRNVRECRGSGHCTQGCPTGQRQSMNVSFVPRAVAAGARVYATCRAERIMIERGRAVGVSARFRDRTTGRGGPRLTVRARRAVVVAASAIQTPLLLLASGVKAGGRVGRGLQTHPGLAIMGVFDRPVEIWFGATQGYETMQYWDERMKLETVGLPLEMLAARLPAVGPALMRELAACGHLAVWGVELRAQAQGRVRRRLGGGAYITYDLTARDIRDLKVAIQRLTRMMFAAGAREVLPGVHGLPDRIRSADEIEALFSLPDDPRLFHFIAAHLFGTARMGPDPRSSVVGPTLEAHELPGLHVLDSSVFPSNIGVNPQHTIAAISWLAAERLASRISAPAA